MIRYNVHQDRYKRDVGDKNRGRDNPHTDFISCRKCRFIFDRSKRRKGHGEGNRLGRPYTINRTETYGWGDYYGDVGWGGGARIIVKHRDPLPPDGCPFCGTYEYD